MIIESCEFNTEKGRFPVKAVCCCCCQIPGLVSLKRHPSVVFLGIDTLEDIRNNSYNELFVSGGCIVSDDLVLNPDFITPGTHTHTHTRTHTHTHTHAPPAPVSTSFLALFSMR